MVQKQMQDRAQAQIRAQQPPKERSENIELPDIASEYSDSDDEDKKLKQPGWTQSPDVREQLNQQRMINPDDVFGTIPELQMAELFKTTTKFRARTSSANWAGGDRLTAEEEREYALRMGYER
jgi:hypothetical protein